MPPGLMGFSQGDDQSGRLFFTELPPNREKPSHGFVFKSWLELITLLYEINSVWRGRT